MVEDNRRGDRQLRPANRGQHRVFCAVVGPFWQREGTSRRHAGGRASGLQPELLATRLQEGAGGHAILPLFSVRILIVMRLGGLPEQECDRR